MSKASIALKSTLLGSALILLPACATMGGGTVAAAPQGQPGIPFSGVRPVASNQAVLDALRARNMAPLHALTPAEARQQPTFADGVMDVMRQRGLPTTPPADVTEQQISIRGAAGNIPARVFRPANARGTLPVIVYFHGGGWVIADSQVYASSARGLAREAQAIVVSVDYRRAPEAKFPAAHDDALAAYRWALANAASLGGDPARVALAGESAGGNLAVATAIAARDANLAAPRHVLAVYPVAGTDVNTPSYQENANAMPLNRAGMLWFVHHSIARPADVQDPRMNLVAANLRGLPPMTVIQAQVDPLTSEGSILVERLRAAGVDVQSREYRGTTHEFFGADAVIPEAAQAQRFAGERLRAAFGR